MKANRRDLLRATAGLGLLPMVGRTARADAALESVVSIRTSGGAFGDALKRNFFDPFSKATGVRVIPISASYGEMMAKTAAMEAAGSVEWDIIAPQFTELEQISSYLADLGDCSSMPNIAKEAIPGTCGRWGVLYVIGGQMLCWNPDAYKDRKPQSWADFWDVQTFPGRRGMANTGSPWATLIFSLLADGVPRAQLFPLDLDRAFRKLDEIKPHVAVWWHTGDQSKAMWRNSDISMSMMWNGTAYEAKHSGIPIEWTYNQAIADFGAWCILKGAPHPNAARAFINFYMANPESHAAFAREMGYTTPNRASQRLLTAEEMKELITPDEMTNIITIDAKWLAENRAKVLERWNGWVSA
ncbi:MAG: ABC transporter substrate-binding protein [Acidisphaera sp.]|nr:ABC transporter substrate-binding protein [Acidisphaera sp.]